MAADEIIHVLSRYSEKCVADQLDAEFAAAIQEAMRYIALSQIEFNSKEMNYIARIADLEDCRNQLCMSCGEFKINNCGKCRWKR